MIPARLDPGFRQKEPIRDRYDVVIAGARVAGASTALLLARAGMSVLVVDPLPRGRDTLSTHALMRGAVMQLHRWGVLDAVRAQGTPAITHTTFDYGPDQRVTIPIKSRDGVDALYAPRRTVLDPILASAAGEAGAQLAYGYALADLMRDETGRVCGAWIQSRDGVCRKVRAGLVIGADGMRSKVARLVKAPVVCSARHATASIYGYWDGMDSSEYIWSFRPRSSMGVIPTNDGQACVFASVPPEVFKSLGGNGLKSCYRQTIRTINPKLADQLAATGASPRLRGFAGVPGFMRQSAGPGWALVGDAGYFKDPLTAHGITDALRDAELLARALCSGGDQALSDYQALRHSVGHGLMEVTDRIASLEWDLDEVQDLHRRLAREMNAGVELIRTFDDESFAGATPDRLSNVGQPDTTFARPGTSGEFASSRA